ncbi:MAG: ABC transporter permease subunit [Caldisericaceae bacterium]|nr:ABC transporter permease subunit [Caldisericaceae bacterium]
MWPLIKKELKENLTKFIIMFLVMLGTAFFLIPYGYNMVSQIPGELFNNPAVPGWLRNQLNAMLPNLKYIDFFIFSQWFGKNLLQFAIFFSIIMSIGTIAGETERKSSIFLFSRPVKRKTILLSKVIVVFSFLIISIVIPTYLLPVLSNSIPLNINMHLLNIGLLYAVIGTLATAAISIFFSTLINDRLKATFAAFAVIIITIPMASIKGMHWINIVNLYVSTKFFQTGMIYFPPLICGIGIIIFFLAASYYILKKKEF